MILFTELKKVVLNSESVNKAMPILCVQLRTPFRVPRVSRGCPLARASTVSTFAVFILKERHPLFYETILFTSFVLEKQNYYLSFYIRHKK